MSGPQNQDVSGASSRKENFPTFSRLLSRFKRMPRSVLGWFFRNRRRFAVALLIFAALWVATNIYASFVLNREMNAIRQRGEPLTVAELAPPPIPDTENAALLYRRAASFKMTNDEKLQLEGLNPRSNQPLSPQEAATIRRRLLQKNEDVIELVRRASRLPACHFPHDWNQSVFGFDFPDLAAMRQFARVFRASALQKAMDGQMDGAIEDVGVIFRMSEHMTSDPILITYLVSYSTEAISLASLSEIMSYPMTEVQRARIRRALPRASIEQSFQRALRGERAFGFSAIADIYSGKYPISVMGDTSGPFGQINSSGILQFLWKPMAKLDQVWFLKTHPAAPNAIPPSQAPWYAFATQIMSPVFDRAHETARRTEASRQLAAIALSLEDYKAFSQVVSSEFEGS
jgi:hypothetical protein